jgi:hypothetical protein
MVARLILCAAMVAAGAWGCAVNVRIDAVGYPEPNQTRERERTR